MCDYSHTPGGREGAMVVIAPGVHCDPCLEPLIRALHKATHLPSVPTRFGPDPIRTIASCCGHGRRPARITLADDRELLLMDRETLESIRGLWPGINDEPATITNLDTDHAVALEREAIAVWLEQCGDRAAVTAREQRLIAGRDSRHIEIEATAVATCCRDLAQALRNGAHHASTPPNAQERG